jgi:hypothetical protein
MEFNQQMKTTPTVSLAAWVNSIYAKAKTLHPHNDREGGAADQPLGLFCDPKISTDLDFTNAVAHRAINRRNRCPAGNTVAQWLAFPNQVAAVAGGLAGESDIAFKFRCEIWMRTQDAYPPFYDAVVASLPDANRLHILSNPDANRTVSTIITDMRQEYSHPTTADANILLHQLREPADPTTQVRTLARNFTTQFSQLPAEERSLFPNSYLINLFLNKLTQPERDAANSILDTFHINVRDRRWDHAPLQAHIIEAVQAVRDKPHDPAPKQHPFAAAATIVTDPTAATGLKTAGLSAADAHAQGLRKTYCFAHGYLNHNSLTCRDMNRLHGPYLAGSDNAAMYEATRPFTHRGVAGSTRGSDLVSSRDKAATKTKREDYKRK